MPSLLVTHRLQPSLLDRLTDHDPQHTSERAEARVMNERDLREAVRRDLDWLLNTTQLAVVQDLSSHAQVRSSVVNYGIGALAGKTETSVPHQHVERIVREAILRYEPRLIAETVKVRALDGGQMSRGNAITLRIEADLWMQPLPARVYLQTEIDLESGAVNVREAAAER
jgi:type VI secretion system protein ImpF